MLIVRLGKVPGVRAFVFIHVLIKNDNPHTLRIDFKHHLRIFNKSLYVQGPLSLLMSSITQVCMVSLAKINWFPTDSKEIFQID